jgi:hypothetical protein
MRTDPQLSAFGMTEAEIGLAATHQTLIEHYTSMCEVMEDEIFNLESFDAGRGAEGEIETLRKAAAYFASMAQFHLECVQSDDRLRLAGKFPALSFVPTSGGKAS